MTILSGHHLSVTLNDRKLLDDVSFEVGAGELVGLIGPNGAGKSTLLKSLLGLQNLSAGHVVFQDKPLTQTPIEKRGRHMGYVAQGNICHWPMTVAKIVEMGRLPYQRLFRQTSQQDRNAVEAALCAFDIEHLKDRLVSTLSGGERARVMLARAFAGRPDVLIADEPTADLDPGHQLHVMNVLQEQARKGCAIVVVLHDLNLAVRFCDRLYLLDQGRLKSCGESRTVINATNMAQAYGIEALIGCHEAQDYIVPWRLTS